MPSKFNSVPLRNNKIKIAAFFNALFLTIPIFYFVYLLLFPLIYFLLIFITSNDGLMFFWVYWFFEALLVFLTTKLLIRLFAKASKLVIGLLTICSITLFSVFGVETFPDHSHFPSQTVTNIIKDDTKDLNDAIKEATRGHKAPASYPIDKIAIERSFMNYLDTMQRRDYSSDEFDINEEFFGRYSKNDLDSIATILVDTIVYDSSLLKRYVGIIYKTKANTYYGQGFIEYKKDSASFPLLYSFQYSTPTLMEHSIAECSFDLRKEYFLDIREIYDADTTDDFSPLDKQFWAAKYFMKGPDVDSLYFFQTRNNYQTQKRSLTVPYIPIK